MADENLKRYVALPYSVTYGSLNDLQTSYGAMRARVGLFKALFKDGADMVAGCGATDKTVTVKSHTRTRKIGGDAKTIQGHTYDVALFPKKNVSFGKGGEEYKVLLEGRWWSFRVSGKQTDFHAFLCQNKSKLLTDMYYKTQNGASYYVNKNEEA